MSQEELRKLQLHLLSQQYKFKFKDHPRVATRNGIPKGFQPEFNENYPRTLWLKNDR